MQIVKDGIAVVGFVGADRAGIQALQEWQRFGAVAGLSSGQMESGQGTQSFDYRVNLRAQSTTGSSERLIAVFFAAPAAC